MPEECSFLGHKIEDFAGIKNHRFFKDLIAGKFVDRPNRFTVTFGRDGKLEKAHLRDPWRLKELLTPDADLLLRPALKLGNRLSKP
jgi:sugar fermentation stimulation protein A